uniref:Uncharacterized protein n=1 Tax=Oryza rufipogon TaxID=4529 RepID=A0A0E0N547_ORYRU
MSGAGSPLLPPSAQALLSSGPSGGGGAERGDDDERRRLSPPPSAGAGSPLLRAERRRRRGSGTLLSRPATRRWSRSWSSSSSLRLHFRPATRFRRRRRGAERGDDDEVGDAEWEGARRTSGCDSEELWWGARPSATHAQIRAGGAR